MKKNLENKKQQFSFFGNIPILPIKKKLGKEKTKKFYDKDYIPMYRITTKKVQKTLLKIDQCVLKA